MEYLHLVSPHLHVLCSFHIRKPLQLFFYNLNKRMLRSKLFSMVKVCGVRLVDQITHLAGPCLGFSEHIQVPVWCETLKQWTWVFFRKIRFTTSSKSEKFVNAKIAEGEIVTLRFISLSVTGMSSSSSWLISSSFTNRSCFIFSR